MVVVAHDLRSLAEPQPPMPLIRFVESDWVGPPNALEDPRWVAGRARVRWSAARRRWITKYVETRSQFDRLFGPDVVYPVGTQRQIEYDLSAVLTGRPHLRSDHRWAVRGP